MKSLYLVSSSTRLMIVAGSSSCLLANGPFSARLAPFHFSYLALISRRYCLQPSLVYFLVSPSFCVRFSPCTNTVRPPVFGYTRRILSHGLRLCFAVDSEPQLSPKEVERHCLFGYTGKGISHSTAPPLPTACG